MLTRDADHGAVDDCCSAPFTCGTGRLAAWVRTGAGTGLGERVSRPRKNQRACITLSCAFSQTRGFHSPLFCNVQTWHVFFYVIQAKSGVTGFVVVARLRGEELDTASDWITDSGGREFSKSATRPGGDLVCGVLPPPSGSDHWGTRPCSGL